MCTLTHMHKIYYKVLIRSDSTGSPCTLEIFDGYLYQHCQLVKIITIKLYYFLVKLKLQ